jgi:hypothetical protein
MGSTDSSSCGLYRRWKGIGEVIQAFFLVGLGDPRRSLILDDVLDSGDGH